MHTFVNVCWCKSVILSQSVLSLAQDFCTALQSTKRKRIPQNPQTWFWPTALIHGSVSVSLMSCGRLTGYCQSERAGGYAERLGQSVFAASVSWLKVKIAHSLVSCAAFFLAEWMEDATDLVYFSRFSGRSHLNTDPLLKIRNMTTAVTFVYSVEINNTV